MQKCFKRCKTRGVRQAYKTQGCEGCKTRVHRMQEMSARLQDVDTRLQEMEGRGAKHGHENTRPVQKV